MFRSTLFHTAFAMLIMMGLLPAVFAVGPKYEGVWFPVTTLARLETVQPTDEGRASLVTVVFDKRRPCEFLGLAWYEARAAQPDYRVRIEFRPTGVVDDSGTDRDTGEQVAGPWLVELPPDLLSGQSYAIASHRCHPLWVTRTVFYRHD